MLNEVSSPVIPPHLEEDQLIAKVRDEFSKYLKKSQSLGPLVNELRTALSSREDALVLSQAEIQNLKLDIIRKEEVTQIIQQKNKILIY